MACYIIAEAGVNHNGSLENAFRLCDAAKEAGADAVKFQIFKTEKLVTKSAPKADYQNNNDKTTDSQFQMLKQLELSNDEFIKLSSYCKKIGIEFLATAFDDDSVDFLYSLGVGVAKVPSGEITNLPYLVRIAKLWKKILLSTGMASFDEIRDAYNVLTRYGATVEVLHCTTEYPAPFETVNLKAMQNLGNKLGSRFGYSDHTRGIEVSVAAVALGATVIEKHFTLDKSMPGPDHKASLEPKELKKMVEVIRNVEKALGSAEKIVNSCEKKNALVARKSIVAKINIKKGDVFTEHNLTTKRPGVGISPMKWFDIIGTKAKKDYQKDDLI